MSNWEGFEKMVEGQTLLDAIDIFFDRVEELGFTDENLREGTNYIAEKGMLIMSTLVAMEVMLCGVTETGNFDLNDLNIAITTFARFKELAKNCEPNMKEQISDCLEDLREAYPDVFMILDENSGNA